jgi:hypothetical protein
VGLFVGGRPFSLAVLGIYDVPAGSALGTTIVAHSDRTPVCAAVGNVMRRAFDRIRLVGAALVIGASIVLPEAWRELRKALS